MLSNVPRQVGLYVTECFIYRDTNMADRIKKGMELLMKPLRPTMSLNFHCVTGTKTHLQHSNLLTLLSITSTAALNDFL